MTVYEKAIECGFTEDAAAFISEWYPEYEPVFDQRIERGYYDYQTVEVMTEKEFTEFLDFHDITEEEYEYNRGTIFRDAAFDGVIVIGQ